MRLRRSLYLEGEQLHGGGYRSPAQGCDEPFVGSEAKRASFRDT